MGDLGRSPRMQYHALALADEGAAVDVIAYEGCTPFPEVIEHPRIRLHLIGAPSFASRFISPRLMFLAYSIVRLCAQSLRLLWLLLFTIERPDILLVQNPPAVPTFAVALLVARIRSAKLIIDWHNFSYSMLALRLGDEHWAVRLLRGHERTLGRLAGAHLCVSHAMRSELSRHWGIPAAAVLYDRPARMFVPTPPESRSAVIRRVLKQLTLTMPADDAGRPAIVVAPTSWTADEDMSLLIDAAARCDQMVRNLSGAFTDVLVLITGRGPMRDHYEREIARLELRKFSLQTLWLEAEDYASLLGSADIGVCCHRSASGFDLPMKIADMFGAGVPVCALDYGPCLAEMVRHGENGLLFTSAEQLAAQLYDLLKGFPASNEMLGRLRANVVEQRTMSWRDGWKKAAAPVFARSPADCAG